MGFPILLGLFGIAVIMWVVLLIDYGLATATASKNNTAKKRDLFLFYGMGLTLFLNGRYFIDGPSASIAFFVGIYDVLHNLVASQPFYNNVFVFYNNTTTTTAAATAASLTPPVAMIPCIGEDVCSVWDDSMYNVHCAWGVSFYNRFKHAPQKRTIVLLVHIFFNTLAFFGMMYQIYNPASAATTTTTTTTDSNKKKKNQRHVLVGWITLGSLVMGTGSAALLSLEHGDIDTYGGNMSMYGFLFMAACVVGTGAMGIVTIRDTTKNYTSRIAAHKRWMNRCTGSMWGSFWIFRVMELVLGPFLTHYKALSILLCIWLSAPLGILVAELVCNNNNKQCTTNTPTKTKTTTTTTAITTTTATTAAHVKQA